MWQGGFLTNVPLCLIVMTVRTVWINKIIEMVSIRIYCLIVVLIKAVTQLSYTQ